MAVDHPLEAAKPFAEAEERSAVDPGFRRDGRPGEDRIGSGGGFGAGAAVHVTGEIPAKGSMAFSCAPNPPLPKRADGSFQTTAAAQSFTEIGD